MNRNYFRLVHHQFNELRRDTQVAYASLAALLLVAGLATTGIFTLQEISEKIEHDPEHTIIDGVIDDVIEMYLNQLFTQPGLASRITALGDLIKSIKEIIGPILKYFTKDSDYLLGNVTAILTNITYSNLVSDFILQELIDLNCAIHKCESIDEDDVSDMLNSILDFIEDHPALPEKVYDYFKTYPITAECLHFKRIALLSDADTQQQLSARPDHEAYEVVRHCVSNGVNCQPVRYESKCSDGKYYCFDDGFFAIPTYEPFSFKVLQNEDWVMEGADYTDLVYFQGKIRYTPQAYTYKFQYLKCVDGELHIYTCEDTVESCELYNLETTCYGEGKYLFLPMHVKRLDETWCSIMPDQAESCSIGDSWVDSFYYDFWYFIVNGAFGTHVTAEFKDQESFTKKSTAYTYCHKCDEGPYPSGSELLIAMDNFVNASFPTQESTYGGMGNGKHLCLNKYNLFK
ncbi:hypothetical protein [Beihai sea slater virus 4]|uniref:hypothetical protein n=1 Tax=Beihai sea slater virus 4 TaxID=1922660 RepID=UPI00090AC14D|nr:hypothetical protein [Beihai sea slater virus 4]APG77554.1 hypothetical protein [Beihai sea slater virus 4]